MARIYKIGDARLPSVTTILSAVLERWSSLRHIPPEILERAAGFGTAVHHEIAHHLKHGTPSNRSWAGDEDVVACTKAALDWVKEYVAEVIVVEKAVWHLEIGAAGQLDLLCRMKHEKEPVLVDWKTSAKIDKRFVALQTAAYALLINVHQGIKVGRRLAIQIPKGAKAGKPVRAVTFENNVDDENAFVICAQLYHYMERRGR